MTDKVKKVLENMWRNTGPGGDLNIADDEEIINEAAHQLNQMLIEAQRDLLQRIVINTNIYLENSDITAEQLRDKLKEELETLSAALKAEKEK